MRRWAVHRQLLFGQCTAELNGGVAVVCCFVAVRAGVISGFWGKALLDFEVVVGEGGGGCSSSHKGAGT